MNLTAKIDLLRLRGATVCPIKGAKETKTCLIIPIEDSGLYAGQKGVYLNVSIFERKGAARYGDWTHSIRLNVDGEIYKNMTDEEKKAIPFLGDMKPIETAHSVADAVAAMPAIELPTDGDDDLPF